MATMLWYILSTLLIIYLRCSFIEGLETTIDITVEGNDIFQSGVRQYTVYGRNEQRVTIKCVLNTVEEPTAVSLLNNDTRAEDVPKVERLNRFTLQWSTHFRHSGEAKSRDRYTCKALFLLNSASVINGSQSYSTIYSVVELEYVTSGHLTAFSVGLIAYTGEQVSISCKGEVTIGGAICSSPKEGKPKLMYIQPFNNSGQNETIDYDCGYYNDDCNTNTKCQCNLHIDVVIWPKLELFLVPSNFSSNVTSLQFTCTSVPPRLMRWTIITDRGNILDFRSSDDIIKVSMNVTITQRSGETILNISEASAGGNGILSVICSSYDTLAKVSVSSHRVFIEECSDGDTVTTVQSTVTVSSMVTVPTTTPTIKSTAMNQKGTTTNYEWFHTTEEQLAGKTSLPQNCERQRPIFTLCAESMHFMVLLLFVTTLVCILSIIVLILLRKLRLAVVRAPPSTCDENDQEPSETVLHDNPVYFAFSETAASSPDDAAQNDVYAYANI